MAHVGNQLELCIALVCFHAEFQEVGTQPTAVGDIEAMSCVLLHLQTTSIDELDALAGRQIDWTWRIGIAVNEESWERHGSHLSRQSASICA
jgi:hypothetical protein